IVAQLLEIYWVKRAAKAYSVESLQSDREPLPKKRGLALIPRLSSTVSANAIYKDSSIGIHRAHRLHGHGNNLIPTIYYYYYYYYCVCPCMCRGETERSKRV